MSYTIRTLHRGIWGPTGLDLSSRKEAEKMRDWGYSHYDKTRIVKATKGNLTKYIKKGKLVMV